MPMVHQILFIFNLLLLCIDPWAQAVPRLLFMDSNIKDLSSLNPFTHLYVFNIGMHVVGRRTGDCRRPMWY